MNPQTRTQAFDLLATMYERVQAEWPGFRRRDGQEAMMDAALATFLNCRKEGEGGEGENLSLVEGPTGTGKTLGYLLAAAAAAKVLDKTVVVSTATVALQDQLLEKDLPRLQQCLGDDLSFAILKGRHRYVCLKKLSSNGEPDAELLDLFGDESAPGASPRKTQAQPGAARSASQATTPDDIGAVASELSQAFEAGHWDGDRDKWTRIVPDPVWAAFAADSASCTRSNCSERRRCPFYEARKRAQSARIQVANHSLVLATLANDSTTIDPGSTLFVFDEGHHLTEVGLDQFTSHLRLHRTVRALARTRTLLPKAAALTSPTSDWKPSAAQAAQVARECEDLLGRLEADVLDDPTLASSSQLRFEEGRLPPSWQQVVDQLGSLLGALMDVATPAMSSMLDPGADAEPAVKEKAQAIATEWAPWMSVLREAHTLVKQWQTNDRVPLAKWLTVDQESGGVTLLCSPLTAAKSLSDELWSQVGAAVVTSATLTACGTFDFFVRLSGLNRYPARAELVAPAAFDYQRQARLCIPAFKTTPKDGAAFTAELAHNLPGMVAPFRAGQLCLFASRRQMEAVYEALPAAMRQDILIQGNAPRARLLAEHRDRVESGRPSILFGLQSLGEGVDLPGRLCEHVVIERIPFAPPDSPVDAALSEWLMAQQRDAFNEVSVPRAAVKLAQWVGRAVRTVDDKAVITICDTRLRNARYGRRLLQGLPAIPAVAHPKEAQF